VSTYEGSDVPDNIHLTRVTELLRETKFDLQIQGLYDLRMVVLYHGNTWIQVRALDEDGAAQNGRMWHVSPFASDSEIVMTAFNAWLAYLEHEARKAFTFRDTHVDDHLRDRRDQ